MTEVFSERLKSPIPTQELQRRWTVVAEVMKKEGIDVILSQNITQYMGGYGRYLTDTTAENAYPQSVLFTAGEEIHFVAYGGPPLETYPPKYAVRSGSTCKNQPYFSPFRFTHDWEGKLAMQWLKDKKIKRFGVEMGITSMAYYDYLVKALPDVEFVDCSDLVDQVRALKSDDEIAFIRKAADIQDKVFGYIPWLVYPGEREFEIRNRIFRLMTDLGAEENIVLMGSALKGETFTPYPSHLQNRTIEASDQLYICLSNSGPGGYFTTIGRMISIGNPGAHVQEGWELAMKAQEKLTNQLQIGADPQVIFAMYNEFLTQNGCAPETGLFAYGQGYDWIERPSIQPCEKMPIQANMCLAINTNIVSVKRSVYCADSFLTTAKGPERLHKTPQKIIIV